MATKSGNPGPLWRHRWRVAAWSMIGVVLAVPAIAMQFTDEVNWGPEDFLFIGLLLTGAGAVFELIAWATPNRLVRVLTGLTLFAMVALIWIEAAVGIFH